MSFKQNLPLEREVSIVCHFTSSDENKTITIEIFPKQSESGVKLYKKINPVSISMQELAKLFHQFNEDRKKYNLPEYHLSEFIEESFRIDSEDGAIISSGWVFGEGDAYFRNRNSAEKYCRTHYDCSIAELYDDDGAEVYWTEWIEGLQDD